MALTLDTSKSAYSKFENAMRHGVYGMNNEQLLSYLQSCLNMVLKNPHISVEEQYYFSKKVFWRLLNSLKRSLEVTANSNRSIMCRNLLNNNVSNFRLDNSNKGIAFHYLRKNNIKISENLTFYLTSRFANDVETPAPTEKVVYTPENFQAVIKAQMQSREAIQKAPKAFAYVNNYLKKSTDFDLKNFLRNVDLLLETGNKLNPGREGVHFKNLYRFMAERAQAFPCQQMKTLFDEGPAVSDTIDKRCVLLAASAYSRFLGQMGDMKKVNPLLSLKFTAMLKAVVRKNSFSRHQVKEIAKTLKNTNWTSRSVESHLNNLGASLVDVFDRKQNEEIRHLNNWVYNNAKDSPIERQAITNLYMNMLYQKMINGIDIGKEDFTKQYRLEKASLGQEICNKYQETGDRKLAASIVMKRCRETNEDKAIVLNRLLDGKCNKCAFYGAVSQMLKDFNLRKYTVSLQKLNGQSNCRDII